MRTARARSKPSVALRIAAGAACGAALVVASVVASSATAAVASSVSFTFTNATTTHLTQGRGDQSLPEIDIAVTTPDGSDISGRGPLVVSLTLTPDCDPGTAVEFEQSRPTVAAGDTVLGLGRTQPILTHETTTTPPPPDCTTATDQSMTFESAAGQRVAFHSITVSPVSLRVGADATRAFAIAVHVLCDGCDPSFAPTDVPCVPTCPGGVIDTAPPTSDTTTTLAPTTTSAVPVTTVPASTTTVAGTTTKTTTLRLDGKQIDASGPTPPRGHDHTIDWIVGGVIAGVLLLAGFGIRATNARVRGYLPRLQLEVELAGTRVDPGRWEVGPAPRRARRSSRPVLP